MLALIGPQDEDGGPGAPRARVLPAGPLTGNGLGLASARRRYRGGSPATARQRRLPPARAGPASGFARPCTGQPPAFGPDRRK